MFTGLIETLGTVISCDLMKSEAYRLVVSNEFEQVEPGESIAVDGVCLTALPDAPAGAMMFDLSPETSQLTTLAHLKGTGYVHLERALIATARIGGHFVTGHIEAMLSLKAKQWHGDCLEMIFGDVTEKQQAYLLPKGSIALAGVSLTINEVNQATFSVMLIPHTLKKTHLSELQVGDVLNVEFDYLTKIIVHQVRQLDLAKICNSPGTSS
jgi:riboflavin synthase